MTARALDELVTLESDRLYVFVAGPGVGEGLAIALPGHGWILVDGCRASNGAVGTDLPLLALRERFNRGAADAVEWMVLTHPHEDHSAGFAEIVNAVEPRRIGIAGLETLAPSLIDMVAAGTPETTLTELRKREALAACLAMQSWEQRNARLVDRLCDGKSLCTTPVSLHVRAPDADGMRALLAEGWERLKPRVNSLSVVLELRWDALRLVFGGDLPVSPGLGTGWDTVVEAHPHLRGAHGVKIPHHASRSALHDELLSGHDASAVWWVTPYSRSRLPRTGVDGGLTHLLTKHSAASLTSLPHSEAQRRMPRPPASMDLTAYESAAAARMTTGILAGTAPLSPARHGVLSPVWGAAFGADGALRDVWRGEGAFTVTRPAAP